MKFSYNFLSLVHRILTIIPFYLKSFLSARIKLKLLFYEDKSLWRVEMARRAGVKIGKNCRLFSYNFFSEPYLVEIGDNVIISGRVMFVTHDGGVYLLRNQLKNIQGNYGRIKVGDNCFIGIGATILQNVSIGNNCIVAAGAVVSQSFPDNCVIMGNPAKLAFKTSMYTKMKMYDKGTILNDAYPFPMNIPESIKRTLLTNHFNDILQRKHRRD